MILAPLQRSDEYIQALRQMGVQVHHDPNGPRLTRRFPFLGSITYLPRTRDCDTVLPAGLTVANAEDANADMLLKAAGFWPVMTPQTSAILDIAQNDAGRMQFMHGKWRNRLRAARSAGLRLQATTFAPRTHDWLLVRETDQRRVNRYTGLPHRFVRAYPPDKTLVITASHNQSPIAAMVFLLHPPGATYHIGWSGNAGRKHNAHTLILWRAAQLLRQQHIEQIDLGILDTVNAPGLARFKLGSGAKPVITGHTWVYLPGLSPMICAIRRRGGFLSGLLSKGSIGGPRTSQETPHGSAQHRHYRPR